MLKCPSEQIAKIRRKAADTELQRLPEINPQK